MKYLFIFFTFILTFSVSCKKVDGGEAPSDATTPTTTSPATPVPNSSIVVSSKTATAFTLTWPAAVDDATATASLQYKAVYSTSDNLTTAALAEANGTIALNWTANTLTALLSSL